MTPSTLLRSLLLLAIGASAGAFVATRLAHREAPVPVAAQATTLQSDVAHLKDIVPGQSHAMIDVGYHMANLWFAAERKNWAFAAFEVDETRNRIRWTIRINPVRKDPEGKPVDLKSIFEAIDTTSMASLKQAVEKQDSAAFGVAYRQMLESCYACHKASGKPYLRPMIPSVPPQSMMTYDPSAAWPE
jgi:cytochrome c553